MQGLQPKAYSQKSYQGAHYAGRDGSLPSCLAALLSTKTTGERKTSMLGVVAKVDPVKTRID